MKKLILIPIIFLINIFIVSAISTDNLLGFYRFEEGSGLVALDSSVNLNNLDIVGAVYNGSFEGSNTTGDFSLKFDGIDDYATGGNIFNLGGNTANATILGWFNTTSIARQSIVSKKSTSSAQRGFILGTENGNIFVELRGQTSDRIDVATVPTYNDGQWHHVAITYNGTSLASGIQIFVDLVLQNLTVAKDTLSQNFDNTNPFNIGASNDGDSEHFTGQIDEIALFSIVLNITEITEVQNGTLLEDIIPPVVISPSQKFDVTVCSSGITDSILLAFFIFISLIFIAIGFATNIGFIGLFGALMLFISSWFIAPCINIFARAITLLSMLLFMHFILRGIKREDGNK